MTNLHDDSTPTADAAAGPPATAVRSSTLCERRFAWLLAGICLLGLVIRLLIVAEYVAKNPFSASPRVDAKEYWQWADRVAHGQIVQEEPFFSAPLYPYLLGLLRAVGGTLTPVYVLQSLLDILTAALLARVCRRRFGPGAGLAAAALFLLLQEPAAMSLRVLNCSLQLALLTWTWGRLVAVQDRPTWPRRAAVGAAIGLLCLSYPPVLLLVPLVAFWLFWQSSRRWTDAVPAAVTAVIACLVIAPATLHNWWKAGEFIPVSAQGGITLYQGNVPGADWTVGLIPGISRERDQMHADAARLFSRETGRAGTWGEIDRYFVRKTFASWRAAPLDALKRMAMKTYAFLTARNYGDIYMPTLEIASGFADRLRLAPIQTAWLMGPALIAVIVMLRRPIRFAPELFFFALPLLLTVFFFYTPRYRLPALPVVAGESAWVLTQALRWRGRSVLAAVALSALGVSVLLGPLNQACGFDTPEMMGACYEVGAGIRFEEQGDAAKAREHYERALRFRSDDPDALSRLGRLAFREGRGEESLRLFQAAADVEPADAVRQANLGKAFLSLGRLDQAEASYNRALELDSGLVGVHTDLAQICLARNQPDKAIAQWQAAIEKDPAYVEAYLGLAACHERMGRFDQALAEFQAALKIAPRHVAVRIMLTEFYVRQNRLEDGEKVLKDGLSVLPGDLDLLTSLAWLYATSPQADQRRGEEAVRMAEYACRASQRQDARHLDVLAAAYAEVGRFPEAIAAVQESIRLVQQKGPSQLMPGLQYRLQLYQSGRPFHWQE